MANRHRGYVTIEIDGDEFELQFTYDAIARLEERLNQDFFEAFGSGSIGFRAVREALAVGLSNPRNDRRRVSRALRQLQVADFGTYAERLVDAFEAAGLFDADGEDDEGEAPAPGRGKRKESTTTNSSG